MPVRSECAPRLIETLSLKAMSVVGESSEREAPLKVAKFWTLTFGMLLSKRPPAKSCGNWKP